jgi:nucleotide-binding universal stress UspA family protein
MRFQMSDSLVVGIDGSTSAAAAVDTVTELAKDLSDKVYVVFGYEPPGRTAGEVLDHARALEELGGELGRNAVSRVQAAGVEAELKLVDLGPVEALLSVAELVDARMIAVGSHGESPLKGAILGSVPHKLVQLSERPLLVVRGNDA